MALIKCPECGKEISDKVVACIHCGYPIQEMLKREILSSNNDTTDKSDTKTGSGSKKNSIIMILVATFFVVIFLAVLIGNTKLANTNSAFLERNSSVTKDDANTLGFGFIDHTEFSEYWFDGVFRCGTDFNPGEYFILPLFGRGAGYELSSSPDNFEWSGHNRLLRKITAKEGQYVYVDHGGIMVRAEDIDTTHWDKYGIFLVGKDLPAGEYKMEVLTNEYKSELYHCGIHVGYYQLCDGSPENDPIDCGFINSEGQEYIVLEEGQYLIITNIKLTIISHSFSQEAEHANGDKTITAVGPSLEDNTSSIKNGCFTYSARSFMERFDESDENGDSINYGYVKITDNPLNYLLTDIENNLNMVGMVLMFKEDGSTLTNNDELTEDIINSIAVLVEDQNDVDDILTGFICAADPTLDFTSAYKIGKKVISCAGNGYTHNNINYVVTYDADTLYILISVDL